MQRIGFVDAARSLLILYVVIIIHGLFWLNLLPQVLSSWLLFAMPAIFVVSGYSHALYDRSRANRGEDRLNARIYFSFLLARFTKVLVPYFVYAISCIVLMSILPLIGESPWYALADLAPAWLDPLRFGRNFTSAMLNWHLWFIPVFLLVTAILPIATKIKPFKRPNVWLLLIVVASAEFLLAQIHFPGEQLIKETVYYLLFALLGYYLACSREYFDRIDFGAIAGLAAVVLAAIAFLSSDPRTMDMQVNKFPPNHLFFIFSCFWMALWLYITSKTPGWTQSFDRLARSGWMKLFIRSGYSIYLWQGVGYTVALIIGRRTNWSSLAVWLLAVGLSVGLGLIASPAERIRWRWPAR